KKIRGRKRHLLVDTQGFVLKAVVHGADLPDRDGAHEVLADVGASFPRLQLVWMDQGYRGERLKQWMSTHHLRQEMVQRPRRSCWCPPSVEPPPVPVFTVLPRRWVVERSFGWLGRGRRRSKDYEEWPRTGEAMIYAAMLSHLLRRSVRRSRKQHTEELCQVYAAAYLIPVLSWSGGEKTDMTQIIVKDFPLHDIPQAPPGAREDPVEKSVPELRK
ncbi:MAG: transposase, partial [Acidobacteriia bacterium]|nr:transposase [Terriglobia bacterium]